MLAVLTLRISDESGAPVDQVSQLFEGQGGTIGRAERNDWVLPDNAVSSLHCRIHYEDACYFIEDVGSSNGTFIDQNPERLIPKERVPLCDGSVIRIRPYLIHVSVEGGVDLNELLSPRESSPAAFETDSAPSFVELDPVVASVAPASQQLELEKIDQSASLHAALGDWSEPSDAIPPALDPEVKDALEEATEMLGSRMANAEVKPTESVTPSDQVESSVADDDVLPQALLAGSAHALLDEGDEGVTGTEFGAAIKARRSESAVEPGLAKDEIKRPAPGGQSPAKAMTEVAASENAEAKVEKPRQQPSTKTPTPQRPNATRSKAANDSLARSGRAQTSGRGRPGSKSRSDVLLEAFCKGLQMDSKTLQARDCYAMGSLLRRINDDLKYLMTEHDEQDYEHYEDR